MDHSPPVPAAPDPALSDPMLGALRRHHPDVDVVLLPPVPPEPPSLAPATEGQCRSLQGHARAAVDMLAEHLGVELDDVVSFWWRQAHPLVHRWVVRASLASDDPLTLLRRTGQRLADLGWDARPAADGSPRLRATTGHLEVLAAVEGDGFSLRASTRPLHVPRPLMDTLADGEELADE